ncbi:MAG TPA: glycogen debranching protein GlgX [Mycobacteriales bacterium]|nr:glycogen debranching protein GlgX [Mycobacteriales bacterium]
MRGFPAMDFTTAQHPGDPFPLGATWDGAGTNFALFAPVAERVDLCLFDPAGAEHRVELTETTYQVWHGHLADVGPGQRYGYRVHGRYDAATCHRANPSKLLADPYARAFTGELLLDGAIFGAGRPNDAQPDHRDSARFVPKSVIVHDEFDWGEESRPSVAWPDSVIYELHVKGMTMRHPDVPPAIRGTYAGLAHPAVIDHLRRLGVTAVELLPVHQFLSEPRLLRHHLTNYWGYNTHGFFAPHAGYSATGSLGQQVSEFKEMVRALHAAGIEVILDVVFNHTAEGDEHGPTLSLRGIDNSAYYRLREGAPGRYADFTGTGNTLDTRLPHVVQLVMDSLRYWVSEMHVDGFRFDLASALARATPNFDPRSSLLTAIAQDPVVSQVKLIAEPWDIGPGGYQVGRFPALWSEWNGPYRDAVRDFWRGGQAGVTDIASRLAGSSDLYEGAGRRPWASINFVTCHDGFSLRDLVSYERKHNDANGEHNRDGSDDNRSWNCGVEGETDDPAVLERRDQAIRTLLATLLVSAGVPMLRAGDELGQTQGGNNNAYCQDNETSWLNWDPASTSPSYVDLVKQLVGLRRRHPVFRRRSFFRGQPVTPDGVKDAAWFGPSGAEMTEHEFRAAGTHTIAMYLSGLGISEPGPQGEPIEDESFLLVLHAGTARCSFTLPSRPWASSYLVELRTDAAGPATIVAGEVLDLAPRSVAVLRVVD